MKVKSVGNDVQAGGKVTSRPPESLGMKISEMRASKSKSEEKLSQESNCRNSAGCIAQSRVEQ